MSFAILCLYLVSLREMKVALITFSHLIPFLPRIPVVVKEKNSLPFPLFAFASLVVAFSLLFIPHQHLIEIRMKILLWLLYQSGNYRIEWTCLLLSP